MPRSKRKIGFYYLTEQSGRISINESLVLTLNHIQALSAAQRKLSIGNSKFGLLGSATPFENERRHRLVFKSAIHSFRPPLLDSVTAAERDSPKRMQEGDMNKTHVVTKALEGGVLLLAEKYLGSVSIKQIVRYLNSFAEELDLEEPIKFGFETIAEHDFLEKVNQLDRVVSADIITDKRILGSDALNYSERTSTTKHEVVITVKAQNRSSIRDAVLDTFSRMNGGTHDPIKMIVTGRNNDNNIVTINTDAIEKQEYVFADINDNTGEFLSSDMFVELESILFNYN